MNISQEARDAQADLLVELGRPDLAHEVRAGKCDDFASVQAFQRAIDAAHAAGKAEGVAEERERCVTFICATKGKAYPIYFSSDEADKHNAGWNAACEGVAELIEEGFHVPAAIRGQDQ